MSFVGEGGGVEEAGKEEGGEEVVEMGPEEGVQVRVGAVSAWRPATLVLSRAEGVQLFLQRPEGRALICAVPHALAIVLVHARSALASSSAVLLRPSASPHALPATRCSLQRRIPGVGAVHLEGIDFRVNDPSDLQRACRAVGLQAHAV